jgi:D-amino-acid dehydrogenase
MSVPVPPSGTQKRVAVLGAGVMGASTALYLARRGFAVTLIDAADAPLSAGKPLE